MAGQACREAGEACWRAGGDGDRVGNGVDVDHRHARSAPRLAAVGGAVALTRVGEGLRDVRLHHGSPMRLPLIAGAVVVVALLACGEPTFLHTNPYDPAFPVTITVAGPDTPFSFGESAHYIATSAPVFPDSAMQYITSDSTAFFPAQPGTFLSQTPPLYPDTRAVSVFGVIGQIDTVTATTPFYVPFDSLQTANPTHAWRHIGSKTVVLTQRVVRVKLRCPSTQACATVGVGGIWSVWADGFDALNQGVFVFRTATTNPAVSPQTPVFVSFTVPADTTKLVCCLRMPFSLA